MKLSEAIREGAKLRPQGFNKMFPYDRATKTRFSCALGAAYEATFPFPEKRFLIGDTATWDIEKIFPELNKDIATPVSGEVQWLQNAISYLNDKQKWTREQIADWLEQQGF